MRKFKRVISVLLFSCFLFLSLVPNVLAEEKASEVEKTAEMKFISDLKEKKEKSANKSENVNDNEVVRIIVQTEDNPKVLGGNPDFENLKEEISKISSNIEFKRDFNYLVSGFSLDVPNKYVSKIASLKGVKSVTYARVFRPTVTDAAKITNATKIYEQRNYKGEGMVISIIDSGIDVNHKDMRLSNPESAKIKTIKESNDTKFTIKVPYGHNYADGTDIVKDSDALGKSMHGMHVAGIAAGNAKDEDLKNGNGIRGIAPEAQLLAMKVFSNNEGMDTAFEDTIVAAIEDSVKLGADVINMSLGADNGFASEDDPEIMAVKRAREQGVICVVSAGNETMSTTNDPKNRVPKNMLNLTDNGAIGSPSTGEFSFSVASSNNSTPTGFFGTVLSDENKEFYFKSATNKKSWDTSKEYELVFVNKGEKTDYNKDGKEIDLSGKVALILRGDISFKEKFENAVSHKAIGIIMINNEEKEFQMAGVDGFSIPSVIVSQEVGEILKTNAEKNVKVKLNFKPDLTGSSEVSSFTAYGPSPELDFKPEVMAPGGNIVSTVNNNKYEMMSGTSMAAPHVSGAIALMLGSLKNVDLGIDKNDFVRLSLTNTAVPLKDEAVKTNLEVSPRRQGAGLIQIDNAINNRVLITDENKKAVKSLKEVEGVNSFSLTLTNYSNEKKDFKVELGNVLTEFTDPNTFEVKDIKMENAKITSDKNSVSIAPKSKATVKITLDLTNAPKNKFAEGYIYFKSDNSPNLVFPYMAFNGDWSLETIFDKPKYEEKNIFDSFGLVSGGNYLGSEFDIMTFTEKINPDKVGFSPNDDDNLDTINVVLGLLRSIKTLKVDIVNEKSEDAKSIVTVNTTKDIKKPLYSKKNAVNFVNGLWDGKVFNEKTGEYEPVPDGQYYMRLSASVASKNTKPQCVFLPFKVDTEKPKIDIVSSGYVGEEYIVKFKAKDNGIGLASDGVGAYVDNEDKETLEEKDGIYEFKVPKSKLNDGKLHTITIGAIDEVFNVKTEVLKLSDNSVIFYNVGEKPIGAKHKYISEDLKEYKLLGYVGKNVSKLLINGKTAEIEDEKFEISVPIKEGENLIEFKAFDKNNKLILSSEKQQSLKLYKDTVAPVLTIKKPLENQVLNLTSNNVDVSGSVSDNSNGKIKISIGSSTNLTKNSEESFEGSTKVDWTRVVKVRAVDEAGNETVKEFRVTFEDDNEDFKIYFKDLSTFEFLNAKSYLVKDGNLVMKGHINKKIKSLIIDGKEVSIKDDLTFEHLQPLKEVSNHIGVKVIGLDDSVIYEAGYSAYYDKTLPNLSLNINVSEDGKIYTNSEKFVFKGSASDNGHGYRLYINGDEVLFYDSTASKGEETNKREFEKEVNSSDGNIALIEISDSFGNKFSKRYTFVFDNIKPEITLSPLNENNEMKYGEKLSVKTNEDANVEISVDGELYDENNILSEGEHTVVVRATDKAGNVTEKTYKISVVKPNENNEIEKSDIIFNDSKDSNIQSDDLRKIDKENLVLIVEKITKEYVEKIVSLKDKDVDVFDIYVKNIKTDEIVTLPKGKYKVTLPKRQGKEVSAVYYVDDNGSLTEHKFSQDNTTLTFETTHFSKYAVEYKVINTEDNKTLTNSKDKLVKTNISNNLTAFGCIITFSVCMFCLLRKKFN